MPDPEIVIHGIVWTGSNSSITVQSSSSIYYWGNQRGSKIAMTMRGPRGGYVSRVGLSIEKAKELVEALCMVVKQEEEKENASRIH